MRKILKNQNGFGLIGLLFAIAVISIMAAMILPTFTAKMQYKQAQYTVGVIQTIENAENAYLAKNPGGFANLTTLASQGYLSSNFLQSVQVGSYPNANNAGTQIANQAVGICIDNGTGCLNNPGVGTNGYFIGVYNIPANYLTYIEHELPGSGPVGTQDISYVAPIPSSPPVANAQNANYANSAGSANTANTAGYATNAGYANTAGYANSAGLPSWSQESAAGTGNTYQGLPYNNTGNTVLIHEWTDPYNCTPSDWYVIVPPYSDYGTQYCGGNNSSYYWEILSVYQG